MSRKAVIKDMHDQIINLIDETNGGYIIRNRQIVNPERYAEIQKVAEDKKLAAQAHLHTKVAVDAPDRNTPPNQVKKVDELETKLTDLDRKLDKIFKALKIND